MTTTEIDSLVSDVAVDFAEEMSLADNLLREITQNNRQATYAELVYFQKHLGWDVSEVRSQLRRMTNVLRNQAIAGTTQDREAASKEATTATEILSKEGPKVADQIAKLEAKLRSLETDSRLSQKRCDEQTDAVDQLKKLCPQHIVESVRHAVGTIEASIGRQVHDGESRSHELECCLDRSRYSSDESYHEMLRRSFPGAVSVISENRMRKLSLSAAWPSIKSEIEIELAGIRKSLEPLRKQFSDAIAQAELPLSHYS